MSTNSAKTDLGTASVGKLLLRLSLPAIAAQIVNVLYNVVDRMYIGHLPVIGADALTGVGVVFPMIMIIAAFAVLISMGGAPRAAIYMGKGDNRTAEKILGNCAVALVILSVILTAAALLLAPSALRLFGASENTFKYAYQYMTIYAAGTLFVQLALGLNPFITTQGFAKTSMLTVFVGAGLNIVLDPIFMFVFHMGVAGAAWATILSQAVSAAWVLRFLTGSKSIIKIRRPDLHLDAGIILPCLALGVAPFIMQSSESVIAVSFNASLLKYGGDLAVGAMTILSSVMQFSMLPIMGLTQGGQPIIGFNYGARKPERVKRTVRLLLVTCLAYSTMLWILVMTVPGGFARIFTDDPALISITAWALRIYMAVNFIFGAQIACQQTFIALGNAKASAFLAFLRKFILLLPLIFIMPHFFTDKVQGVFAAEPVADFIAVSVTIILFTFQFRKTIREMERPLLVERPAAASAD